MGVAARLRRWRPAKSAPTSMTLVEHLAELRRRVMICLVAAFVAGVAAFVAYPHIFRVLVDPYCAVARRCQLYVTGPLDGLSVRLQITTYGALVLAAPVLLWQLWRFVTPGLRPGEKRYAVPFLGASLACFAGGTVVAYLTFPHALGFLDAIGGPALAQRYNPRQYLGLLVGTMAVFGAVFEAPVLLVALELTGVVSPAALARNRRWAFLLIVVVAAVITPSGDPFSMLALALPLYLLFEGSVLVGKLARRGRDGVPSAA
jgi:sec-independent protein translocase protein TatC